MGMKLKTDEEGHAVVIEGKPVFVDDDGKDVEVNVPVLFQKVRDLNAESKANREKANEYKAKLTIFKGIEDLDAYKKEADAALEKVKNFTDKDLIDAGKVEEIKREMKVAHESAIAALETASADMKANYENTLQAKDETIYNLMVSAKFAQSNFFSGEKPKTNLQPEIAEAYFGHHFKVVERNDGKLNVVTYINGKEVFSRKNPGELADFDEGLEAVIDAYPKKNQILNAGGSGSGAGGGGDKDDDNTTEIATLEAQYKKASNPTTGDPRQAIVLKNRIFDLKKSLRQ